MSSYCFEVDRANLQHTQMLALAPAASQDLAQGEAMLQIDRFALTANNVTYGVVGDMLGYWQFFPTEGDWGRIPVWGIATVLDGGDTELKSGDRYYGYFPMASYLVVQPQRVTQRGFSDGAANRQALSPVYNQYSLMNLDNGFDPAHDNHQMVYRPLFTTSFVLDDYLFDNSFFGASKIILGSASSKTAFGLAFLLHNNRDVTVTGLTSSGNIEFVRALGIYDEVLSYEDLEVMDATEPVAYVDMSGNREVLERLHHHFQGNMKCSCGVGVTHWDARDGQEPGTLPGAKPTMFFAPSQIEKRNGEWGHEKFQQTLAASWSEFLGVVDSWVTIETPQGSAALQATFETVLAGAEPSRGYVVLL